MDRARHVDTRGRRGALVATVAGALAAAALLAVTVAAPTPAPPPVASLLLYPPTPAPAPTSPSPSPCPTVNGFDCTWAARLATATALVDAAPGQLGVILIDRATGARFTAGATGTATWAGSTVKLGMAALVLDTSGGPDGLAPADRVDLAAMLAVSDDDAASRVWERHGGRAMLGELRARYGMSGLAISGSNGNWGAMTCTPGDLAALMVHVLDRAAPAVRDYLVDAMRHVGDIQRWGVWAAGPALAPGVKNSWLENPYGGAAHWNTSTIGFAGPAERWVVAVMYQMPAGTDGSLALGVHTVSDLVAVLLGAPTPAPVTVRPT
ncbi:hypothetical protein AB0M43_33695 [Longispora sp. NPDC051575]|uniref:hypothetical protein n=1 Tax=Longispora sp. NPDC051575 TaxID=3154943 RepID=UPI00343E841B